METGSILLDGQLHKCEDSDLHKLTVLGEGMFGVLEKVRHRPTNTIMAVKRIPVTVNNKKQRDLVKDLDKCLKSGKCAYLVQYYGALMREGDVWICMEIMDFPLCKLCKTNKTKNSSIPEDILGKIACAVVKGLHYLHSELHVQHRDVKPSNVLLSKRGDIKVCDFAISGNLVDSVEKTMQTGCKPYVAPERIAIDLAHKGYEMLADIWSSGITMVEVAIGSFPFDTWEYPMEQLNQVVHGDPPRLPPNTFSPEFEDFIVKTLTKDVLQRASSDQLLEHPFIKLSESSQVNMADYLTNLLEENDDSLDCYRCGQ